MISENNDVSKRLESVENNISELAHETDITKFKEELFEVLLIISTLKDKKKITFYLKFFERLIKVMKAKKVWDEVDEELMKDVLTGVAENWREYKREELAKLFEYWLKKNIVGGD
jgi:DNA-binding TFAR19-related protein (PDSD5 family)